MYRDTPRYSAGSYRAVARTAATLASVLIASATSPCSWAEATETAQASNVIEEIVVTSRKREETMQTVPVAVTSYTGLQLESQGIRTPIELGRSVPGLRSSGHPSSASIVAFEMRGQTAGDVLSTVDTAVGLYIDGVYVARPRGLNAAFFDLDRVEVLKGPQGTLYGRNTTGGAINMLSRGADYDGVHGFVRAEGGEYDDIKIGGAVNIPLVEDKLAVRLAYQTWERDGFGESAITGQDIGQQRDQDFFRASIEADPTDRVNIKFKYEYYKSRENGNINVARHVALGFGADLEHAVETGDLSLAGLGRLAAGMPTPEDLAGYAAGAAKLIEFTTLGADDWDTVYYETPQHDWFDSDTLGLTMTFDLGDNLQLQSITGYRHFKNRQVFDLDGVPSRTLEVGVGKFDDNPIVQGLPGQPAAPFQTDPGPEQDADFFSQEFTLSGIALDGRLEWLGGAYYSNEEGSDTQHAQALPVLLDFTFLHDGHLIENRSWSIYTQEDYAFTDRWSLTVGARYTEEDKALTSHSRIFLYNLGLIGCLTGVPGVFDPDTPEACETVNQRTFDGWSWLGSLNWQVNDDTLVYLRSAQGFRGGAFQLRSPTLAPAEPEEARDIEIGLKADLFDGRMRVNFAGYTTDYSNKQESIIVLQPNGNSATVLQNAADATLRGFELEIFAVPLEGLSLAATVDYLWGEYDSFPGALTVNNVEVDASGERFAYPPWTYTLRGRYELPIGNSGRLAFQADWAWQDGARPSDRFIDVNVPEDIVNEFVSQCLGGNCFNGRNDLGILNVRAEYEFIPWNTTLAFAMTNALDHDYQYAGVAAPNLGGIQTGLTGEPRMWTVTLEKRFGEE